MRIYRAATLVVMIALALLLLAVAVVGAARTLSSQSLAALGVVLVATALAGIAFSWKRYFPRQS